MIRRTILADRLLTPVVYALLSAPVSASPFAVPIDEGASNVVVQVCVLGGCDSDSSTVAGQIVVSLDDPNTPALIELHDFDLNLSETIDIFIPILLGDLTATGTNFAFAYATPGTPQGPVPISGDQFSFIGVPATADGDVAYVATGTVCLALQAAGRLCVDTIDLAAQGVQTADFDGTVVVQGGIATLTSQPFLSVPIDPTNPDLGTLTVSGTIAGSAPVPDENVPTVSQWGLLVLSLLVLSAGTLLFRRGGSMTARSASIGPGA